jgi:hypothetical protein
VLIQARRKPHHLRSRSMIEDDLVGASDDHVELLEPRSTAAMTPAGSAAAGFSSGKTAAAVA